MHRGAFRNSYPATSLPLPASPAGWSGRPLGLGLVLFAHPDLRMETNDDGSRGLSVLGIAVDPDAPAESLTSAGPDLPEPELIHRMLRYGGSYVVVRHGPTGVELFTDPGGMMQVFYKEGRVASTPTLLPALQRDREIDRSFPLRGPDDWYPGSLVPYVGVRALLANHRLDVPSGERVRFWPRGSAPPLASEEGIERIAELLAGMVRGAMRAGPLLCSLTGGRDSRVILAATRVLRDEVEYFTLRSARVKRCDLEIPARLAQRFNLAHGFVDAPPPELWLRELYDEGSASMIAGAARDVIEGCRRVSGPDYVHLNGNLGALTKSFFWPSPHPRTLSERALIKEFVNRPECVRRAVGEWRETLPAMPASAAYNLMYLEQRGGRYAGLRDTASGLFFQSFAPFCQREIFETICALPESEQRAGRILTRLVDELWPDLAETPYCPVTRTWGAYLPKRWKAWLRRVIGEGF